MADPYPITGIIFDTNGLTTLNEALVRVINLRTGEIKTTTSVIDGSYSVTFTDYENADHVFIDAYKSVNDNVDKYGTALTTIDTSLSGREQNVTVFLRVNKGVERIILRTPVQDMGTRTFLPDYNSERVTLTGFNPIQMTITRNANNYITQIEENDGLHTKRTTFTRDSNNYITSISERIL